MTHPHQPVGRIHLGPLRIDRHRLTIRLLRQVIKRRRKDARLQQLLLAQQHVLTPRQLPRTRHPCLTHKLPLNLRRGHHALAAQLPGVDHTILRKARHQRLDHRHIHARITGEHRRIHPRPRAPIALGRIQNPAKQPHNCEHTLWPELGLDCPNPSPLKKLTVYSHNAAKLQPPNPLPR